MWSWNVKRQHSSRSLTYCQNDTKNSPQLHKCSYSIVNQNFGRFQLRCCKNNVQYTPLNCLNEISQRNHYKIWIKWQQGYKHTNCGAKTGIRREGIQSQVKVFLRVFKSVILHRIIMPTLRITLLSTLIGTISCTSLEQHKLHWLWHSDGYTALWHNLPRKTLLKQCGTKTDYPRKGFCGETFHRPAMELFTYAAQIHLIRKDVFNLSKFLT